MMEQASAFAAPPSATQPVDAIRAAADFVYQVQTHNTDGVTRTIAVANADENVLKAVLVKVLVSAARYEAAMADVFGTAAVGQFGTRGVVDAAVWEKAAAVTTPNGANVTVTLDGKTTTWPVVFRDGRWRMTFAAVAAFGQGKGLNLATPTDEPLRRWSETAEVFDRAAKAVRARTYPTANEAAAATEKEVNDAIRGANAN